VIQGREECVHYRHYRAGAVVIIRHEISPRGSSWRRPFWLERDLDEQRGSAAIRAGHVERAADRLDAVAEPGQAGSPGGVGTADPVIADRQPGFP
jgi:hypothetical protein